MKNSSKVNRESRRNALKGMAVLSGAAVVTASTSVSAAEMTAQETPSVSPKTLGYRETEHIRDYYRVARF